MWCARGGLGMAVMLMVTSESIDFCGAQQRLSIIMPGSRYAPSCDSGVSKSGCVLGGRGRAHDVNPDPMPRTTPHRLRSVGANAEALAARHAWRCAGWGILYSAEPGSKCRSMRGPALMPPDLTSHMFLVFRNVGRGGTGIARRIPDTRSVGPTTPRMPFGHNGRRGR